MVQMNAMLALLLLVAVALLLNVCDAVERRLDERTGDQITDGQNVSVVLTDRPALYVCAIAMMEDDYIQEWVRYNLLIGFDHVFIYDNNRYDNSTDPQLGVVTKNLPNEFPGKVTVHSYPEFDSDRQRRLYSKVAQLHAQSDTYIAFLDVDDFLVLGKYKCVRDMLTKHAFDGRKSLGINWFHLGSNNHIHHEKLPLTQRFQYRAQRANQFVKVIVYCPDVVKFHNPHWAELRTGRAVYDLLGNALTGGRPLAIHRPYHEVLVHHFAVKSLTEYQRKIERGRATTDDKRDMSYFHRINNMSTVHDDRAHKVVLSHTPATCGVLATVRV